MSIIVVDEKSILAADSVMPGAYGSTQVKGEVLIKTHRHSDPASPFHEAQWINLYGTHGFTPDRVHPAMVYDDPTENEINESREGLVFAPDPVRTLEQEIKKQATKLELLQRAYAALTGRRLQA